MKTIEIYGDATLTIAHIRETIEAKRAKLVQVCNAMDYEDHEWKVARDEYKRLGTLDPVDMVWSTIGRLQSFASVGDDGKCSISFRPDEVIGYGHGGTIGAIFRHEEVVFTYHT